MEAFDETGFSSATYKVLYQIAARATTDETLFDFAGTLHRLLAELIYPDHHGDEWLRRMG